MIPSLQDLSDAFARLLSGGDAGRLEPGTASIAATSVGAPAGTGEVPASPATPAEESGPIRVVDYPGRGWHFEVTVPAGQVVAAAEELSRQGFAIDAVTGVDWMALDQMEVVYDFFHPDGGIRAVARVRVPRAQPEVPTISTVFPGANWHERETHEFFGIRFLGHPNLSPLLLPEDADYHPLRKDFTS